LHPVPRHRQLVQGTEALHHSGDVREIIEGESQAAELREAAQLIRKRIQTISIQTQCL
ncbi:hypothetical protein M9458_014888, partial [Cirrhinus mrigala]